MTNSRSFFEKRPRSSPVRSRASATTSPVSSSMTNAVPPKQRCFEIMGNPIVSTPARWALHRPGKFESDVCNPRHRQARVSCLAHVLVAVLIVSGCDNGPSEPVGGGPMAGRWSFVATELTSATTSGTCAITAPIRFFQRPTTDQTGRFETDVLGFYENASIQCGADVTQSSGTLNGFTEPTGWIGFELSPLVATFSGQWSAETITGAVTLTRSGATWTGTFTATRTSTDPR